MKHIKTVVAATMMIATCLYLPQTRVEAASGEEKELMLGEQGLANISDPEATDLSNWRGDYLYWGKDAGNPLRWQILAKNTTDYGNAGMLLLSGDLGATTYNTGNYFYDKCLLDTYILSKYESSLTAEEKAITIDGNDSRQTNTIYNFQDQPINNKKWFAPNSKLFATSAFGFDSKGATKDGARNTNMTNSFWISTAYLGDYAKAADMYLYHSSAHVTTYHQARATTKIDPQEILFVSAAKGGKAAATGSASTLAPIQAKTSDEWKVTLRDSGQSISRVEVTKPSPYQVELTLDKKGNGESVSAIITDASGTNIMQYGRVANVGAGEQKDIHATIQLPTTFFKNGYQLKLFTEKYNGETATDYASDLVDVDVPLVYPEGKGNTPVTFSVDSYIPDPENPDNPGYIIQVPARIAFTTTKTSIDTTVRLLKAEGHAFTDKNIEMSVTSKNQYILKSGVEELPYQLLYQGHPMTKDNTTMGTLNGAPTTGSPIVEVPGQATIKELSSQLVSGEYSDTLTYTATVQP